MNKSCLVTRPNHDPATNFLFYWSSLVIDCAKKKKFQILNLSKSKANKDTFISYLKANKPRYVYFNGHGDNDSILGDNNQVLISTNCDLTILKNTIIYALSCNAASRLGQDIVKDGATAFIGYKNKFIFTANQTNTTHPLNDPIAKLFLEPSNLISTSLIKGQTVATAYKKSQNALKKNLFHCLSSASSYEERIAARFLLGDIKSQTVIGNVDAQI